MVEQQEVSKQAPTTARTREKTSFFIMSGGIERVRTAHKLQALIRRRLKACTRPRAFSYGRLK